MTVVSAMDGNGQNGTRAPLRHPIALKGVVHLLVHHVHDAKKRADLCDNVWLTTPFLSIFLRFALVCCAQEGI